MIIGLINYQNYTLEDISKPTKENQNWDCIVWSPLCSIPILMCNIQDKWTWNYSDMLII